MGMNEHDSLKWPGQMDGQLPADWMNPHPAWGMYHEPGIVAIGPKMRVFGRWLATNVSQMLGMWQWVIIERPGNVARYVPGYPEETWIQSLVNMTKRSAENRAISDIEQGHYFNWWMAGILPKPLETIT